MEITIKTDSVEQLLDLMAEFTHTPSADTIADAIVRGNHELSTRLDQMRLDQTQLKEILMATKEEAGQRLDALGAKLDKISSETTALVTQSRELKQALDDAQAAGLQIPDEIMTKIDALASKADEIDSQVDDIAPNPTPTPAEGEGEGEGQTGETGGTDETGNPAQPA